MIGSKLGSIASAISSAALALVLITPCFNIQIFAFSSASAWNPHDSKSVHHLDGISNLLTAPAGTEATSLVNAKRIIHALSSSTTCAYAATARLLRQCKLIKPEYESPESELQKENAQAAYGISMALCETRLARASIPPACRVFETILDRPATESSIEIVHTEEIQSCSNQLYQNPSWTSLMTFKAQSKDLCDSSRIDYQREELLEHFRQATNVIPEIIDALRGQQYETRLLMVNVRNNAAEVLASHQEASSVMQDQAQQSKEQMEQLSNFMEAHMRHMNDSAVSFRAAVADGIRSASTGLTVMQDQAGAVKVNLAEIYAAAAEAVSSISIDVKSSFEHMMHQTNALAEQMIDLSTSGHLQAIQESVMLGRDAATEFATVQTAQFETAQAQLSLSQKVLNTIDHTHGRLDEIQKVVDMLPTSWFDALHDVQERIIQIRIEVRYAATFIVPSFLLLLLGRPRAAAMTLLSYVFVRSIWSICRSVELPVSDLVVPIEELKALAFCLFAAACAAVSLAYTLNSFLGLLTRGKTRTKDLEASPSLHNGSDRPQRGKLTRFEMFASLPQRPPKQIMKDIDRYARGKSVPVHLP